MKRLPVYYVLEKSYTDNEGNNSNKSRSRIAGRQHITSF